MPKYSAFDIIGPRIIGPSSSHTAGAARLAYLAYKLANEDIAEAEITLYGSFAETGLGHGTDKALVAGLLGMDTDDKRLRYSLLLAEEAGIKITFHISDEEREHPNTVKIRIIGTSGDITEVVGESLGGAMVQIVNLNGMSVRISGEYPTLVVMYEDRPGVISKITEILAKHNTNIAFMKVFRTAKREGACMVIETDTELCEDLISDIYNSIDKTYEVRTI
ncbi:MAG TPA: L-serine ammonia-lyase, iron-sulfur-dependent, subunit beta [Clostridiales bacterium]|jgi:L-serine dehydratase|nr:L-serine ammonia-lyase, iron-sulfur-dependent, subunit beta [Clostridiales bacterium]